MARTLSLFDRFNRALPTSTSDKETDEIYALLYRTGSNVTRMNFRDFYEDLKDQTLSPLEGSEKLKYDSEEINSGKELSEILGNLGFPDSDEKHFGAKYKRVRGIEFKLLREFYK
jgi:hypothetical protein|tara:strand:- start:108 stop:452 length:345 start_codon:yes stop_codon:yes gene_type:complete